MIEQAEAQAEKESDVSLGTHELADISVATLLSENNTLVIKITSKSNSDVGVVNFKYTQCAASGDQCHVEK